MGLATAVQFEPTARRDGRPLPALAVASWVPAVVTIAYLPDIVTQTGSMLGWAHAGLLGHSMALCVVAGGVIGAVWARASGASARRLVAVSIGSIFAHDLLDLFQATDRAPFWPFWNRMFTTPSPLIPTGIASEGMLFAVLFLAYSLWRVSSGRGLGALTKASPPEIGRGPIWMLRGAGVAVTIAALVAHAVRERLEHQLDVAERLANRGAYAEALQAADLADGGWISAVKPGRVDVVRAEAYAGLGDRARAEALYLRAYDKDPTNFWAAVDLVEYYASCDKAAAERRRLAQPYLDTLRTRFVSHHELPAILARIERRLESDE